MGEMTLSCEIPSARGLLMRNGEEGCGILTGDSCRRGDDVPGRMILRRCLCRELAALRRSPNSETGESVRGGGRDISEEDLTLPSLSPASLSKNNDCRREPCGWETKLMGPE